MSFEKQLEVISDLTRASLSSIKDKDGVMVKFYGKVINAATEALIDGKKDGSDKPSARQSRIKQKKNKGLLHYNVSELEAKAFSLRLNATCAGVARTLFPAEDNNKRIIKIYGLIKTVLGKLKNIEEDGLKDGDPRLTSITKGLISNVHEMFPGRPLSKIEEEISERDRKNNRDKGAKKRSKDKEEKAATDQIATSSETSFESQMPADNRWIDEDLGLNFSESEVLLLTEFMGLNEPGRRIKDLTMVTAKFFPSLAEKCSRDPDLHIQDFDQYETVVSICSKAIAVAGKLEKLWECIENKKLPPDTPQFIATFCEKLKTKYPKEKSFFSAEGGILKDLREVVSYAEKDISSKKSATSQPDS